MTTSPARATSPITSSAAATNAQAATSPPLSKQAVDYAANQGVEWVALTNGAVWRIYRVSFAKPIDQQLVLDLDLLALNPKSREHVDSLYLLTRESITKSGLLAYHDHKEATSRFFLAAVLLGDVVVETIRRELRRVSPDLRVSVDEIRHTLADEVIKRDAVEGPKAELARKRVAKSAGTMLRIRKAHEEGEAEAEDEGQPLAEV